MKGEEKEAGVNIFSLRIPTFCWLSAGCLRVRTQVEESCAVEECSGTKNPSELPPFFQPVKSRTPD